jgi:WD40 repeat protein
MTHHTHWSHLALGAITAGLAFVPAGQAPAAGPPRGVKNSPALLLRLGSGRLWHPGAVALSFSPDGKYLVSASQSSLRAWAVPSGKLVVERPLKGASMTAGLKAIAHGPKGELYLVGEGISRLNGYRGEPTRVVRDNRGETKTVVVSADSAWAAGKWGGAWIVDVLPLDGTRPPVRAQTGPGDHLAVSPGGALLAHGHSGSGVVSVWRMATAKVETRFTLPDQQKVASVAFSPDGKALAAGAGNGAVVVWELKTRKQTRLRPGLQGHAPAAVAFSHAGGVLACVGGGQLDVWDYRSGRRLAEGRRAKWLVLTEANREACVFSKDGAYLATLDDEHIGLWKRDKKGDYHRLPVSHEPVTAVEASHDGALLAVARGDVNVFTVPDGKPKGPAVVLSKLLPPEGSYLHRPPGLMFSPSGELLVWVDRRLERTRPGLTKADTHGVTFPATVLGAAFLKRRGLVPVVEAGEFDSKGPMARLRRLPMAGMWPGTGEAFPLRRVDGEYRERDREGMIFGRVRGPDSPYVTERFTASLKGRLEPRWARFSADGGVVLLGDWMLNECEVWAVKPLRRLRLVYLTGYPTLGANLSADGREVVYGFARGRSFSVVDVLSGGQVAVVFGPEGEVTAWALSPDGRYLAAGTSAGKLSIVDMPSARVVMEVAAHDGEVSCVRFTRSGDRLVSGGKDGRACVWGVRECLQRSGPITALSEGELRRCWNGLASKTATASYWSEWCLIDHPEQAVRFLAGRLKPVPAVDRDAALRRIGLLGSDDFEVRQSAHEWLEEAGEGAHLYLLEAAKSQADLEAVTRTRRLLERIEAKSQGRTHLQVRRAIGVLERIGTPEAIALLAKLAKGGKGSLLTDEAVAAHERARGRALCHEREATSSKASFPLTERK